MRHHLATACTVLALALRNYAKIRRRQAYRDRVLDNLTGHYVDEQLTMEQYSQLCLHVCAEYGEEQR